MAKAPDRERNVRQAKVKSPSHAITAQDNANAFSGAENLASILMAMRSFLAGRQDEILESICKLVETESPSGDFEGSRAVVDLLAKTAGTIPAINSVERIPVSEHIFITDIARRGALIGGLLATL